MGSNWTERRVVVTGLGAVTPLGNQVDEFWQNLLAGRCGIGRITRFDPARFDSQIAGEVKAFDPSPALPSPKEIRRTDRFSQFGLHAAWQALRDSGLDLERVNRDEVGVLIGSGIGGLQTVSEQCQILSERGPVRLSAFMIPMLIVNMPSGIFSMYHKLRGPNFATCSACATANHALGEAWRTVKMGDAQIMFAGGAEATIVPIGIGGFCAMKALSTRNDDPARASRPLDRERAGFGNTLKMASLKTPSVPHAPQVSLTKSSPVTFFITRPPDFTMSPRPVTKRTPIRLSRQAPTATRRGPETFPATIPPIVGSALVPNNTR